MTQKDIANFEKQTARHKDEFHILDLAQEELAGCRVWDYFGEYDLEDMDDSFATNDSKMQSDDENAAITNNLGANGPTDFVQLEGNVFQNLQCLFGSSLQQLWSICGAIHWNRYQHSWALRTK